MQVVKGLTQSTAAQRSQREFPFQGFFLCVLRGFMPWCEVLGHPCFPLHPTVKELPRFLVVEFGDHGVEARHVEGLVVRVEFLEVLFSGGVAGEEVHGPLAPELEFGNAGTGFVLGGAVDGFVASAFQVAFCYLAEGDEVQSLV